MADCNVLPHYHILKIKSSISTYLVIKCKGTSVYLFFKMVFTFRNCKICPYLFFFLLFSFPILITLYFFTLLSPLSFCLLFSFCPSPPLILSSSYPLFFPRCIWATAAQFSGGPASLRGLRPGTYPGHCPNVALQPDHAHAAGATPHPALLPGGYCGPDGVVQGELA